MPDNIHFQSLSFVVYRGINWFTAYREAASHYLGVLKRT